MAGIQEPGIPGTRTGCLERRYQQCTELCSGGRQNCHLSTRTQDLERFFYNAGQFYWFNINCFLKEQTLMMPNAVPFILSQTQTQDIDTEEDFLLAKLKFQYLKNHQQETTHD